MIEADKIKQENEKKREELRRSYQRLFNTDDGKIVLNDLRLFCGQDRTSVCEQVPVGFFFVYNQCSRSRR